MLQGLFCKPIHQKRPQSIVKNLEYHQLGYAGTLKEDEYSFGWPTLDIIDKLNLTEPLRLCAVRTKGVPRNEMGAI